MEAPRRPMDRLSWNRARLSRWWTWALFPGWRDLSGPSSLRTLALLVPVAAALFFTRLSLPHACRSALGTGGAEVLILDTLGELSALLELASVVLLGGSLTPSGAGHSPVEAALQGKPVVVGPFTPSQEEVLRPFRDRGAIVQVGVDRLEEALVTLLNSPEQQRELGDAARAVVRDNQGATCRTIETVRGELA